MSKIRNGIDPLHPFVNASNNRNEIFYVEFDGFICNRSMNVLANLLLSSDFETTNWFKRYPFIGSFIGMKSNDLFHVTKMYNPYEFMLEIASEDGTEKTDKEIFDDIKLLEKIGYIKYQQVTSFAFALQKMLQENCISKVYIQKEYEFYDWEKAFIKELFDPNIGKIELLEGPSFYAYSEISEEVTTSFINFPQMLDQIHAEIPKEKLEKRLFLVRGNRNTLKYNPELDILEYLDPEFGIRNHNRGIQSGIIFTESIDEDPLNEVILAG